jgi:CubicO group peptidase (beta-lactamase class C family)
MVMKRLLSSALFFAVACGLNVDPVSAAAPSANPSAAEIDALFAEWAKPGSPGCAIAVVRGGRILYSKGYGSADLEHDVPITPKTVFYVGSVSKQFTAYAVVKLAAEHKLSLDDPVREHVSELHDFRHPLTIRHLIHHTSGLRDYFWLFGLAGWREGDLITQKDLLQLIWKQRELNYPPGERYSYSNSNYALLATIVERVSGESLHDWLAHRVFRPLGMTHTQVGDDHERIIKDRAWSYRADAKVKGAYRTVVFPYSGYGAGGIYSTLEDLARWESNLAKPRTLDEPIIHQMFEPGRLNNGQSLNYAFALMVDPHRGLKRIGHTGSLAGYRAYLGFFPDQDLGVIVLSNLASFPPGKAMQLVDLFLGEQSDKPKASESNSAAGRAPQQTKPGSAGAGAQNADRDKKAPALTADELRDYAGAYSSAELETTYMIVVAQSHLVVKSARRDDARLVARAKDEFTASGPFHELHFLRDGQGRVTGFRVANDASLGVLFERHRVVALLRTD